MPQSQNPKLWRPARFTHGATHRSGDEPSGSGIAGWHFVIILNSPLENKDLLVDVCINADIIVCADGGANNLKELHLSGREEIICFPNAICGDLDSLAPEVEEYYRSREVKIVKDPDQDSTDFTKSLKYIRDRVAETEHKNKTFRTGVDVAIFGSLGGRADQVFSQLHHLYTYSQDTPSVIGDLYLITAQSVMFLLEKGQNRIDVPVGPGHFTENVGIIPIGRPSTITTRGLEWDVTDWRTEFGTQMSTSNHIRARTVEVDASERVLFTLELARKRER